MIHLAAEAAAVVPPVGPRRLQAVERHATPEAREEAKIEAPLAPTTNGWPPAGPA